MLANLGRRQWQPTPVLLPRKSHGWRSPVGCSPWGSEESDTTERLHFHFSLLSIGEGNGNPLQYSCLENPRDGGAWWAAVYGVACNRTWLKWLSSSSSSSSTSNKNLKSIILRRRAKLFKWNSQEISPFFQGYHALQTWKTIATGFLRSEYLAIDRQMISWLGEINIITL